MKSRSLGERTATRGLTDLERTWVTIIFARNWGVLTVHSVRITRIEGTGVSIVAVCVLVNTETTQAGVAEVKGARIIVAAGDRWPVEQDHV